MEVNERVGVAMKATYDNLRALETQRLLEKMKQSKGYVSVADLAARFEEIDELYNHEPWDLKQILNNIDIFVPVYLEEKI